MRDTIEVNVREDLEPSVQRPPISALLNGYHVIGLSHHTADLDLRSSLSFSQEAVLSFVKAHVPHTIPQAAILSTCNRTEIYFVGAAPAEVERAWCFFANVCQKSICDHMYLKSGADAVNHLFRVASGLDSAVVGENEILAQVKDSWSLSRNLGALGKEMEMLLQKCLVASKRVRTETTIGKGVTSVASVAVREARAFSGGFDNKSVAIIGAGKTAERIAKELGPEATPTFVNRTLAHAASLANKYGGQALPLSSLKRALETADVVFVAVSSTEPVITREHIGSREMLLVDLGVPITCDPELALSSNVHLLHMDHLVKRCEANLNSRLLQVPAAEAILDEEVSGFASHCIVREASATIQALQAMGEGVRQANLAHIAPKLDGLDPAHRAAVEELTQRLVTGMLQQAIENLRDPLLESEGKKAIARAFGVSEFGGSKN